MVSWLEHGFVPGLYNRVRAQSCNAMHLGKRGEEASSISAQPPPPHLTPYELLKHTILSPLPLPGGGPPPLAGGGGELLAAPAGGVVAVVRGRRVRGARAAPLRSGGEGRTGERLG
jgi:hypothetical protein